MNGRTGSRSGWLSIAVLAGLFALGTTGCVVDGGGPYDDGRNAPYLADLEVNWTLLGSDSPSRCAAYGIDHWVISASGPDERETQLSCVGDDWTSANDFFGLREGTYEVAVTGVDRSDRAVVDTDLRTPLVDNGHTLVIDIDLLEEDFVP